MNMVENIILIENKKNNYTKPYANEAFFVSHSSAQNLRLLQVILAINYLFASFR